MTPTRRVMTLLALCAAVTLAQAQSKKELVQKVLALQQPTIEGVARSIVERPAAQLMQAAGQALQTQVPADKREAAARAIEADVKRYVEEATPLLRERALKLAPSTLGAGLEEKFTEAELKQLIAWLESPVNKKFQQVGPEMQNNFVQKLAADAAPLLDPKLKALEQKVRANLGLPEAQSGGATPAPAATPPKAAKP
ncbi:MAG TPA: DUF2059 domain-containing protein [Burkholderiaceae bacterium]|nr:DUF2059 domain-containing protein [Burkholderiaceae bacterium]